MQPHRTIRLITSPTSLLFPVQQQSSICFPPNNWGQLPDLPAVPVVWKVAENNPNQLLVGFAGKSKGFSVPMLFHPICRVPWQHSACLFLFCARCARSSCAFAGMQRLGWHRYDKSCSRSLDINQRYQFFRHFFGRILFFPISSFFYRKIRFLYSAAAPARESISIYYFYPKTKGGVCCLISRLERYRRMFLRLNIQRHFSQPDECLGCFHI